MTHPAYSTYLHTTFLSHFNQRYPQDRAWQLLHPSTNSISNILSVLRCTSPDNAASKPPPPLTPRSLTCGAASVTPTGSNTPSQMYLMTHESPTSLSLACTAAKPAKLVALSTLAQWRMPSWQWARGSPTWVDQIPARSPLDQTKMIPYSLISSAPSQTKTPQPLVPIQPASPSSVPPPKSLTPVTQLTDPPTSMSLTWVVGFFWLLHPPKYLYGSGKTHSQAFRLCDIPPHSGWGSPPSIFPAFE